MTAPPDAIEVAAPPTNRMVIAVLSMIGFFVALYLFAHNVGLLGQVVCGVGDCETVQSSRWAHVGPVPVSGIGLAGYAALLSLSLLGLPGFQLVVVSAHDLRRLRPPRRLGGRRRHRTATLGTRQNRC